MRTNKWILALACVGSLGLLATGCGGDDDGTDGTADSGDETSFTGGTFRLFVKAVDDKCLDGALEVIFKPDASVDAYEIPHDQELPPRSTLPATFKVQLEPPFSEMDINLTDKDPAGAVLESADSTQTGVQVSEDNPDCKADMSFDAIVTIQDDDNLAISVTVGISNAEADKCPADFGATDGNSCNVTLDMSAARK